MQLISTGSDGLIKLWNTHQGENVATFDGHEDRIWALAINQDESIIITGSSDSTINFWKDVTAQEQERQNKINDDKIIKYHVTKQGNKIWIFLWLDRTTRMQSL